MPANSHVSILLAAVCLLGVTSASATESPAEPTIRWYTEVPELTNTVNNDSIYDIQIEGDGIDGTAALLIDGQYVATAEGATAKGAQDQRVSFKVHRSVLPGSLRRGGLQVRMGTSVSSPVSVELLAMPNRSVENLKDELGAGAAVLVLVFLLIALGFGECVFAGWSTAMINFSCWLVAIVFAEAYLIIFNGSVIGLSHVRVPAAPSGSFLILVVSGLIAVVDMRIHGSLAAASQTTRTSAPLLSQATRIFKAVTLSGIVYLGWMTWQSVEQWNSDQPSFDLFFFFVLIASGGLYLASRWAKLAAPFIVVDAQRISANPSDGVNDVVVRFRSTASVPPRVWLHLNEHFYEPSRPPARKPDGDFEVQFDKVKIPPGSERNFQLLLETPRHKAAVLELRPRKETADSTPVQPGTPLVEQTAPTKPAAHG